VFPQASCTCAICIWSFEASCVSVGRGPPVAMPRRVPMPSRRRSIPCPQRRSKRKRGDEHYALPENLLLPPHFLRGQLSTRQRHIIRHISLRHTAIEEPTAKAGSRQRTGKNTRQTIPHGNQACWAHIHGLASVIRACAGAARIFQIFVVRYIEGT
jgi:hypothetical protein